MRAVVQRVARSAVSVVEGDDERETARIDPGLTVLIGVAAGDTQAEAQRLAEKMAGFRIFPDDEGKLNRDVREAGGEILAISQFTLLADARKGRRPSFVGGAPPEQGELLYDAVVRHLRHAGLVGQPPVPGRGVVAHLRHRLRPWDHRRDLRLRQHVAGHRVRQRDARRHQRRDLLDEPLPP
jgi:D-tyrosyl-tRNA(Tyr) deacylase